MREKVKDWTRVDPRSYLASITNSTNFVRFLLAKNDNYYTTDGLPMGHDGQYSLIRLFALMKDVEVDEVVVRDVPHTEGDLELITQDDYEQLSGRIL